MIERVDEGIWRVEGAAAGPSLAIAFGTHGDERAPVDGGLELVARFERGEAALARGRLLLVHSNPLATAQGRRWSEGGVDLNRCFHADVLAREPELYEERRARAIATALDDAGSEALVDFHCTVEPGARFLMQHPVAAEPRSREVWRHLRAEVLLADPKLWFGGVSLDEHMTTRGYVGICYETGWIQDPANTPEAALWEMENVLAGLGLVHGEAHRFDDKKLIELCGRVICDGEGYRWSDGVGENLQEVAAGTILGRYADGREVVAPGEVTLIFPKKKPELVEAGKPLVLLAERA